MELIKIKSLWKVSEKMSKKESKQSYYYYPDTAYIEIDNTELNLKKNLPQKFKKAFSQVDLSKCSKELKDYLLKVLKKKRKVARLKRKIDKLYKDCFYSYLVALSQLSAKIGKAIDTDMDHINSKKRGMNRLANYDDRYVNYEKKEIDYYDNWDEVLTWAIRKLGGE